MDHSGWCSCVSSWEASTDFDPSSSFVNFETHVMRHGHTTGHEPMASYSCEATYPQEMWTSRTGSLPHLLSLEFWTSMCVTSPVARCKYNAWLSLKNFRVITRRLTKSSQACCNMPWHAVTCCEAINGIKYSEGFNGADGAKLRIPEVVEVTQLGGSR